IGTLGGLSCYDGEKVKSYTERDGLSNNAINSLALDKENNLWVAGPGGLTKYDGVQFKKNLLPKTNPASSSTYLVIGSPNRKLLAYHGGSLFILEHNKFRSINTPVGLHQVGSDVLIDKHGRIWLATNRGQLFF